jgi:hypothetical protein
MDNVLKERQNLDPELVSLLGKNDAGARLIQLLPQKYPPEEVAQPGGDRPWELAGFRLLQQPGREYEALGIFWKLYEQLLDAQSGSTRVHKGMPLVWISDCFSRLGFPVHAKRYLMLALCEDALREAGDVSPSTTGVYFRLVWQGLPTQELERYARRFFELAQKMPAEAMFPEALLQQLDDGWLTELPSAREVSSYKVNTCYLNHLLPKLGCDAGEALELVAEYLMSCMPGCRTKRRQRSASSDYDVVCAMEGFEFDFRSELGRYVVCECKDWDSPVDFTTMAKLCRVLDSIKSRFGVLFSRNGISGAGSTRYAEREQLKVFHDRGVIIVVLDRADLEQVASGANLITMLRRQYETVRLDLTHRGPPSPPPVRPQVRPDGPRDA